MISKIAYRIFNVSIWAIMWLIAAFSLVRELKSEWQLMRVNNGLSNKSEMIAPKKNQKDSYTAFLYKDSYIKVRNLGILISIISVIAFFLLSPVKYFKFDTANNVYKSCCTFIYAFLFFSIIIGIDVDDDSVSSNKSKIYNQVINVIKSFKYKSLQKITSEETVYIKNFIEDKISDIYKNKDVLGYLIIRLEDKFLDSLVDKETENYEKKMEYLQDYCLKLLNLYKKGRPTLLDEVNVFLREKLVKCDVPLHEIVKYIKNTEIVAKEKNVKPCINNHIKESLESNKPKKANKSRTKNDVMKILLKDQHESRFDLIDEKCCESTYSEANGDKN